MVISERPGRILVKPNCSASWQHNRCILSTAALCCLLVAAPAIWAGAWLILPFLGGELLALSGGLYITSRRLQQQQLLQLNDQSLKIDFLQPHQHRQWLLDRYSVKMSVFWSPQPMNAPTIILHCDTRTGAQAIHLGDFLNRDDSKRLIRQLREWGIRTASEGYISHLIT